MVAVKIALNRSPLPKSKAPLDMKSRHASVPFAPFEREQQGKGPSPSLVIRPHHGNPAPRQIRQQLIPTSIDLDQLRHTASNATRPFASHTGHSEIRSFPMTQIDVAQTS